MTGFSMNSVNLDSLLMDESAALVAGTIAAAFFGFVMWVLRILASGAKHAWTSRRKRKKAAKAPTEADRWFDYFAANEPNFDFSTLRDRGVEKLICSAWFREKSRTYAGSASRLYPNKLAKLPALRAKLKAEALRDLVRDLVALGIPRPAKTESSSSAQPATGPAGANDPTVWVSADGKRHLIVGMDEGHLSNTIRCLVVGRRRNGTTCVRTYQDQAWKLPYLLRAWMKKKTGSHYVATAIDLSTGSATVEDLPSA